MLAAAVARAPWRVLAPCGRVLGWLVALLWRVRRAHVVEAMTRAGVLAPGRTAGQMYRSLGVGLFELLWVLGQPGRSLAKVASMTSELRALLQLGAAGGGRGTVLATAHTGNWDLSACVLARAGVPLTVVTKRLRVRWLDEFWQQARAAQRLELVDGVGTFARAADALQRGRHVAMIIDQAPERASAVCTAPFMGSLARCDVTPALLAARTGATLALVLGHRTIDGRHTVELRRVWEPPARGSRAWAEQATIAMQLELAAFVREHPEQWLWLHRRWKGVAAPAPPGLRRVGRETSAPHAEP